MQVFTAPQPSQPSPVWQLTATSRIPMQKTICCSELFAAHTLFEACDVTLEVVENCLPAISLLRLYPVSFYLVPP